MIIRKSVSLHTPERMGLDTRERLSVDTRKRNYMSLLLH